MVGQRHVRMVDPGYLAWLRKQPCAACRKPPPCDAAHLRAASAVYRKEYPGLGRKPDDKWAMPLCRSCHTIQHTCYGNELMFWSTHGVPNPFGVCLYYYHVLYGGTGGRPQRRGKTVRPRKPKHLRAKIPSRPFPKTKRKLRSMK